MLNNLNLNLNILPKISTTRLGTSSPVRAYAPSFCAGLSEDKFENSGLMNVSEKEKTLLKILNASKTEVNPATLEKLSAVFIDRTEKPTYAQNLQGETAFTQTVRAFLLNNLTTKNTFHLTLHQDSITRDAASFAIESGFGEIATNKIPRKMLGEFRKFLGIVYDNEGQEAVDRILLPMIKTQFESTSVKKMCQLAQDYYARRDRKNPQTLKFETIKTKTGIRAEAYLDGELLDTLVAPSPGQAVSLLSAKLLRQNGLMQTAADTTPLSNITITHRNPISEAMKILNNLHFLNNGETLDEKRDIELAKELIVATNSHAKKENSHAFQRFEFIGDAIANNAVSRFVSSQKLDNETTKDIHAKLIENTTFANLAYGLKIAEAQGPTATREEIKLAADNFEAVVGVLYKHYPPVRMDKYLRTLFEYEYKKIMLERAN